MQSKNPDENDWIEHRVRENPRSFNSIVVLSANAGIVVECITRDKLTSGLAEDHRPTVHLESNANNPAFHLFVNVATPSGR